ncbi:MAG: large-conductance mechanosensitive channel protein MscL [Oscillibacter sp.]|jgi:large conductance mechanosensitive channel|nr:large-conductance mechanosensitive channel protein MscL [Oscillibacter sp.]
MADKTSGFFAEFKTFIARGNVMDMAVGVIIGGAFSNITTSLINDIVMPVLGIFTSSVSFADLSVDIGPAVVTYGNFIQAVLNFLIMALVVFCLVKALNRFHKKKEAAPPPPPGPSAEEKLLTEIRDLLKQR